MPETAMKDEEYQAQPMTGVEAPLAYPLVYLHDANVTLDAWLDFVRRRTMGDASGLIVMRDRAKIAHALFAYRVDLDIKGRRQLCIAQLIVAQIPGSQIDQAVIATMLQMAAELSCQGITLEQPFSVGAPAISAA